MATKEQLINRLNEALQLQNRLSHWQFLQIRKRELEELVQRVEQLAEQKAVYEPKREVKP